MSGQTETPIFIYIYFKLFAHKLEGDNYPLISSSTTLNGSCVHISVSEGDIPPKIEIRFLFARDSEVIT